MITTTEIARASDLIAPHVRRTPVMEMDAGSLGLSYRVALELELFQHTGSF